MNAIHKQPDSRFAVGRLQLREARQKRFPGMRMADFAKMLGCSRMHLIGVERGRVYPGPLLLLRWLEVLGPEADFDLFEPHPCNAERRAEAIRGLIDIRNRSRASVA